MRDRRRREGGFSRRRVDDGSAVAVTTRTRTGRLARKNASANRRVGRKRRAQWATAACCHVTGSPGDFPLSTYARRPARADARQNRCLPILYKPRLAAQLPNCHTPTITVVDRGKADPERLGNYHRRWRGRDPESPAGQVGRWFAGHTRRSSIFANNGMGQELPVSDFVELQGRAGRAAPPVTADRTLLRGPRRWS